MNMLRTGYMLLLLVCITGGMYGQTIREIKPADASVDPYFVVEPQGDIQGALILLPGGSLPPESIFPETKLHNVAYLHNLLVVAVDYGKTTIYMTDDALHRINTVLAEVMEKYGIPKDRFVIGGYSAGGITALCYAVHGKRYPGQAMIEPAGVFTADSPVDLTEVWYSLNREIEKNFSAAAVNEARYFLPHIEADMGGTPETHPENYIDHSPFTYRAKDGGNVKYLLNIPIRLHHDTDVAWRLENRRQDLFDMNDSWASAMVNWLLIHGNDRAEFVAADRPARMSNGVRNTHAWSVIEEVGCILWAKKCLGME